MAEKKILRPEVTLGKIKLMKDDGGIECSWEEMSKDGGVTSKNQNNRKCPVVPHPDLIKAIKSLDVFLMKSNGYSDLETVLNGTSLNSEDRKPFERLQKNTLDKISVTGIALSGEAKTRGVIIMGKFACANKVDIAINSPLIKFERDVFKFETELAEAVDNVIEEFFCYTYENKKAQLDIPFPKPNEEGKEKGKGKKKDSKQVAAAM